MTAAKSPAASHHDAGGICEQHDHRGIRDNTSKLIGLAGGGREEPPVALLEVADASAGDKLRNKSGGSGAVLPSSTAARSAAPEPGARPR